MARPPVNSKAGGPLGRLGARELRLLAIHFLATARSNAGWAAAEHEVSKCTVPSFSPSWAGTGEAVRRRTPRIGAARESLQGMKRFLWAWFAAQSPWTLLF